MYVRTMSKPKIRLSLKLGNKGFFAKEDRAETDVSKDAGGSDTALPDSVMRPQPYAGLANLGNTCYANSVLQALRFCPEFCQGVVHLQAMLEATPSSSQIAPTNLSDMNSQQTVSDGGKDPTSLIGCLHQLLLRMGSLEENQRSPCVKPTMFISKLKEEHPCFKGSLQHDAQEMLRFLLTHLQEAHTSDSIRPTQPIVCSDDRDSSHALQSQDVETEDSSVVPPSHTTQGKKRKHSSKAYSRGAKSLKTSCKKSGSRTLTDFYSSAWTAKSESGRVPFAGASSHQASCQTPRTEMVSDIFQGTLTYQTRCFECDGYSKRSQTFLDISVPVLNLGLPGFPPTNSPCKDTSIETSSQVGPYSLSWALSQFANRERLKGANKYWCDQCGHFTEAERSILFSRIPRVMTIHLNRFATQTGSLFSTVTVRKVSGNIAIPLALCLKPWCTAKCHEASKIYHLFAVIFHSGSTCTSGHYTTCIRARECEMIRTRASSSTVEADCQWVYFDDEIVEVIAQEQLLQFLSPLTLGSNTPYILFYTH